MPPRDTLTTLSLWVAQGFGIGRLPAAPGTWGSVAGLVWVGLLLVPGSIWLFVAGSIGGTALSIRVCGVAERMLGRTDPPSVVLDESVAMPVCFAAGIGLRFAHAGHVPSPTELVSGHGGLMVLGTFLAFRFFDIVKPWPVRQSQRLPGGWGVTIDDLLAALYVNLLYGLLVLGRVIA